MKLHEVVNSLTAMQQEVARIKGELQKLIEALPDNPDIQRLSSNAFVISSSKLRGNWSPGYHDFKWQYRKIAEIISRKDVGNMITALESIMRTGKYREEHGTVTFHPEVIKHLQILLE